MSMKRFLAAIALACGFATPASATSFTTDFTDLWWAGQAESGWGVNVIHQGDVLFATFFIYRADNVAHWYVASSVGPAVDVAGGGLAFTGKLYETTGPFFGATFNANNVVATEVGEATFTFPTTTTGTLVYRIGSTNVSKSIARQTFRSDPPLGRFTPAGITAMASSCAVAGNNGPAYFQGITQVTQVGSTVTMVINQVDGPRCTLSGPYTQAGRLGAITGTWGCVRGTTQVSNGTFSMFSLDTQVHGFNGIFQGVDNFCTYRGNVGGVRDVVN